MKMYPDHSKAVSFANSYFALADGLASGIEYFLAENVVLDWFGKIIKGRRNVAAFLSTHKVNSRHVFDDISPSDSIGYNKKSNCRRRKHKSKNVNDSLQNANISYENDLNGQSTPLSSNILLNEKSCSWTKSYCSNEEETDFTLELHDNTLSNIFKMESVKLTDIEEIEKRIQQISLKNKPNTELPKRNCTDTRETRNISISEPAMKFVDAFGEILFSKRSRRQSSWNDYKLISSGSTQTWRKPCKLQIAYSLQQFCLQPKLPANNNNHFRSDDKRILVENQTKLLNFAQIIDLSNQLVPSINDYSDYLRNLNNDREQSELFDSFNEYLLENQKNNLSSTPQYVNNPFSLQKSRCEDQTKYQNDFLFNESIHIIIYEGHSHCRINLSQKFINYKKKSNVYRLHWSKNSFS